MAQAKTKTKPRIKRAAAAVLTPPPRFIRPMLAATAKSIPEGDRWIHEIKHDGWRLQARIEKGKVTLLTRGRMDVTQEFRLVAEELSNLPVKNAILDGEITAPNPKGVTHLEDFKTARTANKRSKYKKQDPFNYFVFDLLFLDGEDLTKKPLIERKEKLQALLHGRLTHAHYLHHLEEDGALLMRAGNIYQIEGFVSKLKYGPYRSDRDTSWKKFKFRKTTRRKAQP